MRLPILLVVLLLHAGCKSDEGLNRVQPPTVVTKIVEKRVDLPTWATEQIIIPLPVDGKVRSVIDSHSERGAWLQYVNCRSRLIEKVQAGENVNIKDCSK